MYHSERDPLHRVGYKSTRVAIPKGTRQRRLHKAFLRYHDPNNWPMLREALVNMGKAHLIGYEKHLVPPTQTGQSREQSSDTRPWPTPGYRIDPAHRSASPVHREANETREGNLRQ